MTPSQKDMERAVALAREAHCRYCESSDCPGDVKDSSKLIAKALADERERAARFAETETKDEQLTATASTRAFIKYIRQKIVRGIRAGER